MAEESKFSKNQQLGLFLASLGDVLSGDKNVVGNAMNRKQFLEQKISDKERKDRYQNFIKDLDEKSKGDNPQYSRSFYELAQALGPKGLDSLLLKKFEADEKRALVKPDILENLMAKVQRVGYEGLTKEEQQLYYDKIIKGSPTDIIVDPFDRFDLGGLSNTSPNPGQPIVISSTDQQLAQEQINQLPKGTKFVVDGVTYTKD